MRTAVSILCSAFFISLFFCGCNNNSDPSPYADLLSQQPYAALTDSIDHDQKNASLYYKRGVLLLNNSNLPPARDDFRKAWELDKKESHAIGLSTVLLQGKPDSAIAFLSDALKKFPGSIQLQLNLAEAYADKKSNREAIAVCDRLLKQQPFQLDALLLKSSLQEEENDLQGSIQTLEQARRFAPDNDDVCYGLAFKYAQAGDPKTISLCDSLIRYDSNSRKAEPYYFKGVYYSNINEKAKALDLFDQALQKDYGFLDAYMDKGKIFYDQKKYAAAEKVYQLALTVSPGYADAYYWLGKCQQALGRKEDAKLNYQRAYGLDHSLTEAKQAADSL
jgi:tetratricopeptide (TPR) repeat protein